MAYPLRLESLEEAVMITLAGNVAQQNLKYIDLLSRLKAISMHTTEIADLYLYLLKNQKVEISKEADVAKLILHCALDHLYNNQDPTLYSTGIMRTILSTQVEPITFFAIGRELHRLVGILTEKAA